jgi:hypothetical protein
VESPSAAAILERVAAVYAAAQTHQDTGVVKTTLQMPQRTWSKEVPFKTAFERATDRFLRRTLIISVDGSAGASASRRVAHGLVRPRVQIFDLGSACGCST